MELKDDVDFHQKCSKLFFGTTEAPKLNYTFDQMTKLAKEIVKRSVSVPGVQAKLSMSIIQDARKNDNRLTAVGALGGNYIFKPPNTDFPEMPQNEHLTMRIAETMGIQVVPSSLIRLHSGELSYITKRIDRTTDGKKIHMIDMFQVTEAYDKYKSSMEKIGKALNSFSDNTLLDKLYFFELCVFSFLVGNNDMHLKNFSMIQSNNRWSFAPAYDLLNASILNPDDKEEMALTIEGKKKKLKRAHFEQFGKGLGLSPKQINGVFKRFLHNEKNATSLIGQSFLSREMQIKYYMVISDRYDRLFG
jgi:serine/threonine-protein kinase HipA